MTRPLRMPKTIPSLPNLAGTELNDVNPHLKKTHQQTQSFTPERRPGFCSTRAGPISAIIGISGFFFLKADENATRTKAAKE